MDTQRKRMVQRTPSEPANCVVMESKDVPEGHGVAMRGGLVIYTGPLIGMANLGADTVIISPDDYEDLLHDMPPVAGGALQ